MTTYCLSYIKRYYLLSALLLGFINTVLAGWDISTVDSAGSDTSIALDTSNNPHISYTTGGLKYAKWTGSSWFIQTVDSAGTVGTSIALDSSNNPHISYSDSINSDLKYAKWTGTSWSTQTVGSAGNVGSITSIALDTSNNPHISYYDSTNGDLKYAKWTGSSWFIQTVDSAGYVGFYTSLALDTSNNPHISYYDNTNADLKYAKWTGSAWSIQTVESAGDVGTDTSIALDSSNNPHISYYRWGSGDLEYAKWTGTSWFIQTVDSAGYVGSYTSLALDTSNNPHISYYDNTNRDLKYAKWTGSSWFIQTVDSAGYVGFYTSLALDTSNNPHISYNRWDSGATLRYAKAGGPPTGVPAVPTDSGTYTNITTLTFNWAQGTATDDPDSGIAGYYLQIGTNTTSNDASLLDQDVGNVLTYNATGAQSEKTYYARVRAKNGQGLYGNYSSWSDGITVDLSSPTPNPPTIASLTVNVSSIVWTATTAADTLSGLDAQPYSFDNGTTWQSSTSSTTTGLQPNTLYSRTLKYRDAVGNVTSGAVISTYTLAAVPTSPSFSSVFQTSFTVTWSNNNNPGGTTYIAEISTTGNFSPLTGSSTTANTFASFSEFTPFTVYYFHVKARNTANLDTAYSQTISAQTGDNSTPTGTPSTPTDSGAFTSSTTLTFNWNQGNAADVETGISGYYLQVGTQPSSGDASLFGGEVGNVLTQIVSGAVDGKTYYARVRAKNGIGLLGDWSGWSDGITVDTTPPAQPTVTSATHPDSNESLAIALPSFSLSGPTDISGIAGYYWKIDGSSVIVPTANDTYSSTGTIQTTTLLSDATWYFHVVAKDGAGNVGITAAHYKFIVKTMVDPTSANTFQSSDGTKVEIPADAVSTAAQLIIQTPSNPPAAVSDTAVRLTPVAREIKLSDGARQFNKEITITLPYSAADVAGMDEQALRLFFYDDTNKLWALIANSTVDTVNKRVTGRVTHLTVFGIAQYLPVSSALENLSNYPNPFSPLQGQTTKIRYSLEQDSEVRIRIYDPMGQLVWDRSFPTGQNGGAVGPNEVVWDGRTGDGRQVAMGGYICIVEARGSKFKRKIGVK